MATTKVPSRCAAVAFSMKKEGGDEITTKLSSLLPSQETGGKKMSRELLPFQKSTNMGSTILTEFNNMFPFPRTRTDDDRRICQKEAPFPFPFPSLFLLLRLSETHFPPELTSSFCAESGRYKGNRKEGNSDFRGRRRSNGARRRKRFSAKRGDGGEGGGAMNAYKGIPNSGETGLLLFRSSPFLGPLFGANRSSLGAYCFVFLFCVAYPEESLPLKPCCREI